MKNSEKLRIDKHREEVHEYSEKEKCFLFEASFFSIGADKTMSVKKISKLYYQHVSGLDTNTY